MRDSIDKRLTKALGSEYKEANSEPINATIKQLTEYFEGKRKAFDLNYRLIGSDFQIKVWETLVAIPYGQTNTYLELSRELGNTKAIRAVASANGANAISIIIPCHRIIGSNQDLIGYAGGLAAKKRLLKLENASLFANQLDLFPD